MVDPARLLGFAFANADLLFEIDKEATVVFATGAASEFVRPEDPELIGRGAARLFEPPDGVKFVTHARALGEGGRAGPLRLKLAGGREVAVSLCHLPQNHNRISCTLTHPGQRQAFSVTETDPKTGLATRDTFLAAASRMADGNSAMTLVDVPGLPEACTTLPAKDAELLMRRIGDAVKAAGTKAAARLSASTFGAIADAGEKNTLAETIKATLSESGLGQSKVAETLVALTSGELSPEQRLLAVRHVVTRFAGGQLDTIPEEDLATAFGRMVEETQDRVRSLTDTMLKGEFGFAYQPIVKLSTGAVTHCEALARFDNSGNTAEVVAFAEALGISNAFDVAIAVKVLDEASHNAQLRVAFNLSGSTISTPTAFGMVAGLLASKRALADRVHIEITETAEMDDLVRANQAIQALRAMGYKVGIDDFGAGAASFQYLHSFDVDFIKFDAALIKSLGKVRREEMLVSGLVRLCGELGVTTIAEGIENADMLKRTRAIGFDLGQGYYFGKPAANPPEPLAAGMQRGKRKGVQTSWG